MRPQYHYAAAANWLSDPNGLVCHAGEWHLFYQYNPQGEDWGHMSWGHAVSRDLATWEELPIALEEDQQGMIFSGSAVIDHANSAGFGAGAMVALYTNAAEGISPGQSQYLGWSTDHGRTWQKYPGNPVLDIGAADFRDPNVFWHAPSARWIMAVVLADSNRALLYASHDLKEWDEYSVIYGHEAPGQVWECPLLIELPIEGGAIEGEAASRWLFKVDVLRGAPGSGAIYCTGSFDGIRFSPDSSGWQVADLGTDFYAAIAWHAPRDEAGRPLWIGWLGNHAYQGSLPLKGWRGAMSLPRRLSLRRDGERLLLRQEMAVEAIAAVPLADLSEPSIAPSAQFELPGLGDFSLRIADQAGRLLLIERRELLLLVTRRDPSAAYLDTVQHAQLTGAAPIKAWLDFGSLELLADGGCTTLSLQHMLDGHELSLCFTPSD